MSEPEKTMSMHANSADYWKERAEKAEAELAEKDKDLALCLYEITALRDEVAEKDAKIEATATRMHTICDQLEGALLEKDRQIAELRKDAQRLDWIATHVWVTSRFINGSITLAFTLPRDDDLREAIDDAIGGAERK